MTDDYMPALPPGMTKRKREETKDVENNDSRDPKKLIQGPVKLIQGPTRPVLGPARPVQGPARPPPSSSPSSSGDEIGPPLPTGNEVESGPTFREPRQPSPTKKLERDEWMLKPPPSVLRVDPTKIKSRQFQRRGPKEEDHKEPSPPRDKDLDAAVQAYNAAHRSKSLLAKHEPKEDKDDPSSRPFDREKDIVGTQRLDSAKSREFIKRASELSDRFGRSKYL